MLGSRIPCGAYYKMVQYSLTSTGIMCQLLDHAPNIHHTMTCCLGNTLARRFISYVSFVQNRSYTMTLICYS